jgi:hypothetical protein
LERLALQLPHHAQCRTALRHLVRGARGVDGLAYADSVLAELRCDSYLGDLAAAQLRDYATVTRAPYRHRGRITTLIESGALCADLGIRWLPRSPGGRGGRIGRVMQPPM